MKAKGNIVSIHGGPPSRAGVPNDDCIKLLERWLQRAKHGEIQQVACVGTTANGCTTQAFHINDDFPSLIGAMSYASWRLNQDYYEDE